MKKSGNITKYIPYVLGAGALLLLIMKSKKGKAKSSWSEPPSSDTKMASPEEIAMINEVAKKATAGRGSSSTTSTPKTVTQQIQTTSRGLKVIQTIPSIKSLMVAPSIIRTAGAKPPTGGRSLGRVKIKLYRKMLTRKRTKALDQPLNRNIDFAPSYGKNSSEACLGCSNCSNCNCK